MEIFLSFIEFVRVFIFVMSVLYILKVGYDIVKVYTLQEGKVEFGKYGLLYLACSVSYVISVILT